jgi:Ca2+-binding EF-hand superfamily protein
MTTWNICAAMVLGLTLGTAAFAESTEEEKSRRAEEDARFEAYFKEKDANGDGKLSLEESTAGLEGQRAEFAKRFFSAIDTDKDGFTTLAEAREFFTKMRKAMADAEAKFTSLDTNADMQVTLAEATAGKTGEELTKATEYYKKLDADGNGFATKDELRRHVFTTLGPQS